MQTTEVIKNAIFAFFWFGENYNSFILWYLLSNIYSLIFIFIIRKLKVSYLHILIAGALIALVTVFLVDYKTGIFEFSGIAGILYGKISSVGARVVTGFFYLSLGIVLSKKSCYEKKIPFRLLIIVGLVFEIISHGYGFIYEALRALATFEIVSILANMTLKPNPGNLKFRKLSSSLYYWHLWIHSAMFCNLWTL